SRNAKKKYRRDRKLPKSMTPAPQERKQEGKNDQALVQKQRGRDRSSFGAKLIEPISRREIRKKGSKVTEVIYTTSSL
ncbi:MAG: hypothetical protein ACREQ3_02040, partial [Candidatus Binatia bacterium]